MSRVSIWVFCGLLLAGIGCGPGLAGVYRGSGEIESGRAFEMGLRIDGDGKGTAEVIKRGKPTLQLPLCHPRFTSDSDKLTFDLDLSGNAISCDDPQEPVKFVSTVGAHVIYGHIELEDGAIIGMWRVFRESNPRSY